MLALCMAMADTPEEKSLAEELYLTYRGRMYGIALGILKNNEDAEDAVQDAFMKAFGNMPRLSGFSLEVCGYYLCTAAKNTALTMYKKNKAKNVAEESIDEMYDIQSTDDVENEVISMYGAERIKAALRKLDDADYELIFMTAFMEKTPTDIAKLTGESAGTVRQRLFRARRRLLNILVDSEFAK
ncbi:MAG: sigma-70 family RNA polymerase sigma factor [Eubacterium sp.]|nr:sigma-70 family RNA polymerase sigma factor [Eubacterium sp.]